MITLMELEKNGYRKFMDSMKSQKDLSPEEDAYKGTWQKCIRTSLGKKYFVNIDHWDFFNSRWKNKNIDRAPSFSAHAQLESKDGVFNVELIKCEHKTVESVESWFEKQWQGNGCKYYEKYDGSE